VRPLALWVLELLPPDDPWQVQYTGTVPHQFFAAGSRREFKDYFTGSSRVEVHSLDDVCDWLHDCQYKTDQELFQQPDFWQHPLTFEQVRQGDCDDHALWAWRKLIELGKQAEFFSGMRLELDGVWAGHAWVVLSDGAGDLVLEAAEKARAAMVVPFATAKPRLRPHFAVDAALKTRTYDGWLQTLVENRRRARATKRKAAA
jgi:hypothetical protein